MTARAMRQRSLQRSDYDRAHFRFLKALQLLAEVGALLAPLKPQRSRQRERKLDKKGPIKTQGQ
jgi:hypothetical protein